MNLFLIMNFAGFETITFWHILTLSVERTNALKGNSYLECYVQVPILRNLLSNYLAQNFGSQCIVHTTKTGLTVNTRSFVSKSKLKLSEELISFKSAVKMS